MCPHFVWISGSQLGQEKINIQKYLTLIDHNNKHAIQGMYLKRIYYSSPQIKWFNL